MRTLICLSALLLPFAVQASPVFPPSIPKDPGPDVLFYAPHEGIPMTVEERKARSPEKSPELTETVSGTSINFEIQYMDSPGTGFLDTERGEGRREVVREVLIYIDSVLDHDGDCRVSIDSVSDSGMAGLGNGGTSFIAMNGFQPGRAFLSIQNGWPQGFTNPDVFVTINFIHNWQDTMEPAAAGQYDLYSVLLHEVTHGLGFLTLSRANGESIFYNASDPSNSYETYSFLDVYLYDDPAGRYAFSSEAVYQGESFTAGPDTIFARATNVGETFSPSDFPPMYSPSVFSQGSSLSHWQGSSPIPGDAVMRPTIGTGVMRRAYLPYEKAFLDDLGYTLSEEASVEAWLLLN